MANPTDHYLLTGLDVHSTIWKTVADDAALAALTPIAEDLGKDVLKLDDATVHKLVGTGPAVWKDITGSGGPATDHGTLSGLDDDDHVRYVDIDGTREQDAVYLTERADHVNTPAAGTAELWVKSTSPTTLYFTDDGGGDRKVLTYADAVSADNRIPKWDGTSGERLQSSVLSIQDSGRLLVDASASDLSLKERAGSLSTVAGYGYYWVRNDAPTTPMFTDDAGGDYQLLGTTGVTAQDAVYLTERADHVNTPGTGKAEFWVDNLSTQRFTLTDDAGKDRWVTTTDSTSGSTTGRLVTWQNAHEQGGSGSYFVSADALYLDGSTAALSIKERAAAPANSANRGYFWVKDDAPTTPWFTDDDANDYQLGAAPHVGKTAAPGTGDNGAAGYRVGNIWVDETNDDAYILLDASTTAVWKKITP